MNQSKSKTKSTGSLRFFSLSAISLAGLALAILLTQHFYEIRGEGSHFKSSCNFGGTLNCDVIAASQSAEFIGGFPLSSFAAGWFLTFFVISLFIHQKYWRRDAIRALFGMSLVGVIISGFYFWVMRFQLHTYCLYCIGIDLCNLAGLFITISLKPELPSLKTLDRSKWTTFLCLGAGSHLLMALGLSAFDQNGFQPSAAKEAADSILSTPPVYVQIDESLPSIGTKDAPITIFEFSDFQCPFCRIGALNINTLLYRYPGKIRIVFKNYPLDQKCNSDFPQTMHPAACEAARTALCAHEQGQFERAYETLFEKQSSLAEGRVAELLSELKLDPVRLSACSGSSQTTLQITRDIAEGKTLGLTGTPTFFVNGHRVDGIRPNAVWNFVIERLLQPKL